VERFGGEEAGWELKGIGVSIIAIPEAFIVTVQSITEF